MKISINDSPEALPPKEDNLLKIEYVPLKKRNFNYLKSMILIL